MLILYGSIVSEESKFERESTPQDLLAQQGSLPQILQQVLTKELDFLQKEHLNKCRFKPEDWKTKRLKISVDESSLEGYTSPEVISMNLVWQESSPPQVLSILNTIPSEFLLSDMFELQEGITNKRYFFRGMI